MLLADLAVRKNTRTHAVKAPSVGLPRWRRSEFPRLCQSALKLESANGERRNAWTIFYEHERAPRCLRHTDRGLGNSRWLSSVRPPVRLALSVRLRKADAFTLRSFNLPKKGTRLSRTAERKRLASPGGSCRTSL